MSIGFHVSKAKTKPNGKKQNRDMRTALSQDMTALAGYGFVPCAQIFVSGPQSFKETLTEDDKTAVRQLTNNGAKIVIHGSYVDNPWNRAQGSIHNIKQEMRIAAQIGATGVIIHLAAGALQPDTVKYVIEEIARGDVTAILWLEIHTAKPCANTYETPEKLAALFRRVAACDLRGLRVGLCIDTAHLFASGTSLRDYAPAMNWLNTTQNMINAIIPNTPFMLHLNDSASALGSGIDEHAVLLRGNIWGDYLQTLPVKLPLEDCGLVAVLEWAENNGVTTILERNPADVGDDLTLIHELGFFRQN